MTATYYGGVVFELQAAFEFTTQAFEQQCSPVVASTVLCFLLVVLYIILLGFYVLLCTPVVHARKVKSSSPSLSDHLFVLNITMYILYTSPHLVNNSVSDLVAGAELRH